MNEPSDSLISHVLVAPHDSPTQRRAVAYGGMIVAAIVTLRCALPTELEADKLACRTPADCVAPYTCVAGRCGLGGIDAAVAPVRAACTSDECGPTERCDNGRCRPRCEAGCLPDEACAPATGTCVLARVATCPATPCRPDQECVDGLCATVVPTSTTCGTGAVEGDGCPDNAVCLIDRCLSFPACPPESPCPVGPVGATCSTDITPLGVPMCLPRACASASSCPGGWRCVPVLGGRYCTDGAPGSPCGADADCTSLRCLVLVGLCR